MAECLGQAVLELRTDDQGLTQGIRDARREATQLEHDFERVGTNLVKFLTLPLAAGFAAVTHFQSEQRRAGLLLEATLRGAGIAGAGAAERLKAYATQLQNVTTIGDEATVEAQALLATFQLTEHQIRSLTPRVQNLATTYDMDLRTAALQVGRALTSGAGALSRYGITLSEAEREAFEMGNTTERVAMLLQILDKNTGDSARLMRQTGVGALQAMKNAAGDLGEAIGEVLEQPTIEFFQDLEDRIKAATDAWRSLDPVTQQSILRFAAWSAALGPALILIGKLPSVLRLVTGFLSGPTGWIALIGLAAGAVWSLVSSLETLEERLERIGKTADIARLEADLSRLREERERLQEVMADPFFSESQLAGRTREAMANLDREIEATVRRIEELRQKQEEAARTSTGGTQETTKAVERWREEVDKLEQANRRNQERILSILGLSDAHADQAEFIRFVENERVQILESQIAQLSRLRQVSQEILNTEVLTAEEADSIRAQMQLWSEEAEHLQKLLVLANEELRLTQRDRVFEKIARDASLLQAKLEAGTSDLGTLLDRTFELINHVESLEDGTLQWHLALLQVLGVLDQIQDRMAPGGPISATLFTTPRFGAQLAVPEQEAREPRLSLDDIEFLFNRLRLEQRAGIVGDEEFVGRLAELSTAFFDLIGGVENLSGASHRQLELFAALEAAVRPFFREIKEKTEEAEGEEAEGLEDPFADAVNLLTLVNSGFDALASRLGEIDPALGALADSLEMTSDGFRFNPQELLGNALQFAVGAIVDLIDTREAEFLARIRDVPDPGTDVLGVAQSFRNFENLGGNVEERRRRLRELQRLQQQQDVRTAQGAASGAALGIGVGLLASLGPSGLLLAGAAGLLAGGAVGRQKGRDEFGPQIQKTEEQIRELEEAIEGARTELIDALGVAADTFATGIHGAIERASVEGILDDPDAFRAFEKNLEASVDSIVRRGIITSFVATVFEPQITALAEHVQKAFLGEGQLDSSVIEGVLGRIADDSRDLFEVLDNMGLLAEATGEVATKMQDLSRNLNVPEGFRVEAIRFSAARPEIPSFDTGGIMPWDGPAMLHRGELVLTPEQQRSMGGDTFIFNVNGARDPKETAREVMRQLRAHNAQRSGNPSLAAPPLVTGR